MKYHDGNVYGELIERIDSEIHADENFDVVRKEFIFGKKLRACFYYINGFGNGELAEKLLSFMLENEAAAAYLPDEADMFEATALPYAEVKTADDIDDAVYSLMSGSSLIAVEGFSGILVADTRKYPQRGVEEPQKDRVLRGPHDGFVEALVPNTGLIRRRIHSKDLIFFKLTLGKVTKTDVCVCYMDSVADKKYVEALKEKLSAFNGDSLSMGLESLCETVFGGRWFDPFPRVRYTERPDSAAAMLLEGSVVILCDNYPSAMLLPTSLLDFLQDTDDFYFPPLIGGYLKAVRLSIYFVSLLIMPVWFLLASNASALPDWLGFLAAEKDAAIPLILQILLTEFTIDGLKIASLNTPDTLTNSLSVIGGLLLGDLAIKVGWVCPQVVFYMSFVAIANFTQTSYELGYAFKIMRLVTLVMIYLAGVWGLIAGIILTVVMMALVPGYGGRGYFYPLFPWNGRALKRLLFRAAADRNN